MKEGRMRGSECFYVSRLGLGLGLYELYTYK